jgi:uncharacterized protein (UPF0333 family)
MKNYLIAIIVLAVIAGTYYLGYQSGSNKIKVKYLEKEKLIHDTTITKETIFRYVNAKIDTVTLRDSIYVIQDIEVASSDTLITKDSSLIKIKYYFPPIGKFDVWTSIKSRIIYRPEIIEVEKPESFGSRFGTSVQTGVGYGWMNKKVDFYTGIGFHFKIN